MTREPMSTMLALAERNVPRYTSYPTAPHFCAAVGPRIYAAWPAELPQAATLSPYLHRAVLHRALPLLWLHDQGRASTRSGRNLCRACPEGHRVAGLRHRRPAGRSSALGRWHAAVFDAYLARNHKRHSIAV